MRYAPLDFYELMTLMLMYLFLTGVPTVPWWLIFIPLLIKNLWVLPWRFARAKYQAELTKKTQEEKEHSDELTRVMR